MIKLFITRHGRTNYNEAGLTSGWDDAILTEEGRAQAKTIGERLVPTPPAIVLCSTLERAVETAEIIVNECGGKIEKRDDLKERNLGILQGLPEEEYQAHLKSVPGDGNAYRPENGESRNDVKVRVARILAEIREKFFNQTILIVGHHSTNRAILSLCLGGDPSSYTMGNCTLSLLEQADRNDAWRAEFLNQ